jgi:hypothetical protein
MHEQRERLIYLAGSLFGKAQELRELLHLMAEEGHNQGEITLLYQSQDGHSQRLILHIDGDEFTMMPDTNTTGSFRLDINDSSLHLE